jgi:hypothetical protein
MEIHRCRAVRQNLLMAPMLMAPIDNDSIH